MRPAGWQPIRTRLQQTRDIMLIVMAFFVTTVCMLILYLAAATGNAIEELRNREPVPTFEVPGPVPTNPAGQLCIGEEPPKGC